jgi:uncharacterized membrane protein (Fun14 family)
MSELLPPLIFQLGVGGFGGFIAGYAFKKLVKIVFVIIGLFVLALIYLGSRGIININYEALGNAVLSALGQSGNWVGQIVSNLPFAGSFGLGLILGFKIG